MKKFKTVRHESVINDPRTIEELVEKIANSTIDAIGDAFGVDAIRELLVSELEENGVDSIHWARRIIELVTELEQLQRELKENIEEIAEKRGFSFEVIALMVHGPYFSGYFKENLKIGKPIVITNEDEGRLS